MVCDQVGLPAIRVRCAGDASIDQKIGNFGISGVINLATSEERQSIKGRVRMVKWRPVVAPIVFSAHEDTPRKSATALSAAFLGNVSKCAS